MYRDLLTKTCRLLNGLSKNKLTRVSLYMPFSMLIILKVPDISEFCHQYCVKWVFIQIHVIIIKWILINSWFHVLIMYRDSWLWRLQLTMTWMCRQDQANGWNCELNHLSLAAQVDMPLREGQWFSLVSWTFKIFTVWWFYNI